MPPLIKFGKVIRAGIGISLIPDSIAQRWGIEGLVDSRVAPGSPAKKAGLQSARETRSGRGHLGDIMTKVNREPVQAFDDLGRILDRHNVGDQVTLEIFNNGKAREVSVTLIECTIIHPATAESQEWSTS